MKLVLTEKDRSEFKGEIIGCLENLLKSLNPEIPALNAQKNANVSGKDQNASFILGKYYDLFAWEIEKYMLERGLSDEKTQNYWLEGMQDELTEFLMVDFNTYLLNVEYYKNHNNPGITPEMLRKVSNEIKEVIRNWVVIEP